ncbi:ABC transporter ATP-binding protein [Rhodobacteraceae bacterium]|nr:ABC transporter ATP-binding protein [Paracoccaceae bacterium]
MAPNGQTQIFAPWADPAAKPLIEFRNVSKRFGNFTAIDNLNLSIYEREFFALLGPSGCGKTTLMRLLAGFEPLSAGTILLDGQDISPIPPNLRAVNMMFQSYALFPHLSVWENIAFGLRRETRDKEVVSQRVAEMLRLTRLAKFANRKPHQISGGQRQRVALARALAKAPKLLLLDEPLGALDKKLRSETQFELMDIQERTGTTFVIVTHDQEEAMTVSSRVALMDEGKMVQVATPSQIYEAPNSIYTADFIGDVNIISGTAKPESRQISIVWDAEHAPIIAPSDASFGTDDTIHFAIRPEKVGISAEKPAASENSYQGKILDIAYLGNISTYHVELPSGHIIKAQTANTQRLSERGLTWEDTVWVYFQGSAGVLLKR